MSELEEAVFDEYLDRRLRGESVAIDALLLAHPELDDGARERLRRQCGSLEVRIDPAPDFVETVPPRIGAYRIVRELGRGGQGVVYLAQDGRFARTVALKVLTHPRAWPAGEARVRAGSGAARLRREAEATSRLNHPGICVVHELVLDADVSYIAMKHVEGETLARRIARRRGPVRTKPRVGAADARIPTRVAPEAEVAPARAGLQLGGPPACIVPDRGEILACVGIVERAALALHAAHEAGVVHRDIKPGNIMVTPAGEPVVLDFGLAQDSESDAEDLTRTGETFGTPAYMPPEQITPSLGRADSRSDVYSLGVTLFECLTLRRPYEAPTRERLQQLILDGLVPDARRLNPAISRDLQVVLQTALDRHRDRRYRTALDFAEDLRRVRAREPIRARPAGPLLRFGRWVQRNPVLATATLGVFVALATGLAVNLRLLSQVTAAWRDSEGHSLLSQSTNARSTDPGLAVLLALEGGQRAPGLAANNALYAALGVLRECRVARAHDGYVYASASSPDGRWLATASEDRTAKVWDLATNACLQTLGGHSDDVAVVAFSADGGRLVTGSKDGVLHVWSTERWTSAFAVAGQRASLHTTAFDPHGSRLLSVSLEGVAQLRDATSGALLETLDGGGAVVCAAFVPDGSRLVTVASTAAAAFPTVLRVWDVSTHPGVLLRDLPCARPIEGDEHLIFTPRGDAVLVDWLQGDPAFLDLATGALRPLATGGVPVASLAFLPDGSHVALGLRNGDIAFSSLAESSPVRRAGHHAGPVRLMLCSPDGSRLLTDAADDRACLWDVPGERLIGTLAAPLRGIVGARFEADGRELFTACGDGGFRWWNVDAFAERSRLAVSAAALDTVAFDPRGERVVTTDEERRLAITDLATRSTTAIDDVPGLDGRFKGATFAPDGRSLLVISDAGAFVLDPGSHRILVRLEDASQAGSPLWDARFSPDGTKIATAAENHEACVWEAATGKLLLRLQGHAQGVRSAAWSGDGRRIVTTSEHPEDGTVRIWDAATGASLAVLNAQHDAQALPIIARLDQRGTRVVAACWDHVARLWDLDHPERAPLVLSGHQWPLNAVDLSPDGERVVTSARDRTVRIWDARTGAELATLTPDPAVEVHGAAFSSDGSTVVSGWVDGALRLWPADPRAAAHALLQRKLTAEERSRYHLDGLESSGD